MKKPIELSGFTLLLIFLLSMNSQTLQAQSENSGMNNEKMEALLLKNSAELKGRLGNWEAYIANRTVYIITDENYNRMRIISPIVEDSELTDEHLKVLLEANFDKALDSKYSIHNGYVWSTFTHPLSELTDDQFVDALQQVVNLVNNFGTSFSSTDIVFGGDEN